MSEITNKNELVNQILEEQKRKELNALENERTQVSFINGQRVYVVDYEAIYNAREEYIKKQEELISNKQKTTSKLIDYNYKLWQNMVKEMRIMSEITNKNELVNQILEEQKQLLVKQENCEHEWKYLPNLLNGLPSRTIRCFCVKCQLNKEISRKEYKKILKQNSDKDAQN